MSVQAKFLTGSPMKHVAIMSFTASLGLMAMFAVDFVDMIFISMLGQAELAAAIGYAGSILFWWDLLVPLVKPLRLQLAI